MTAPVPLPRAAQLARLRAAGQWDVVVVGGGATGLGCALDAAARGLKTALIEQGDFASGASSRSTKLIHGGVRYLAQGDIALVREALRERARLLRNAPPALAHGLGFVIPAYRVRDLLLYGAGLKLYDLLAGRQPLPRSRILGRTAVLALAPNVARACGGRALRGGVLYHDGQFDDSALAIALMRTAAAEGAAVLNYCRADALLYESGRVAGVRARDAETGACFELRARAVINATGVWVDGLRRQDEPQAAPLVAPSQGAHIVLDADFLAAEHALLLPRTPDGRVVFCLPWLGRTLVGTTDTACDDAPRDPRPFDGEIDFLLAAAGRLLRRAPTRADIRASFAGLRPLVRGLPGAPTARLSREHAIVTAPSGLVSVTGGKWTTYRRMAEQSVDAACAAAGLAAQPCRTAALPLLAPPARTGGTRLHPDLDCTDADVRTAWCFEMARTAEDVLARRMRIALLDEAAGRALGPAVEALLTRLRAQEAAGG